MLRIYIMLVLVEFKEVLVMFFFVKIFVGYYSGKGMEFLCEW